MERPPRLGWTLRRTLPAVGAFTVALVAMAGSSPLAAQAGAPAPVVSSAGAGDASWRAELHVYRAQARVAPLVEDAAWSEGARLHSRYMVQTDSVGPSENPASVWYTTGGAQAGAAGMFSAFIGPGSDPALALPQWLASPFHAVALLDPDLRTTGYGSFLDLANPKVNAAATIDVERGLEPGSHRRYPTSWPSTGATVPLTELSAELPDPLTACPGYDRPVGQPIYAFFEHSPAEVAVTLVRDRDGRPLNHCVITGRTYTNPSDILTYVGRTELGERGAVVIVPRSPMVEGESYSYRVRGDGALVTGTFTIGPLSFDPFTDVGAGHRFVDEITWLSSFGIATGFDDGSFRPTGSVSRQALVAFLWRMAGEPAPATGETGFADVPADHPFREAIAWGVGAGLLEGYSDGLFHPTGPVSRQAAMAFLWRFEGAPPASGATGFADVPAGHPFREAIAWGVQHGITEGYADGGFHPVDAVSRQAAAVFLHDLDAAG